MAREPGIGEYTPQIPVQEGLRRIIPEQSPASSGSGLEGLGAGLQEIQDKSRRQDAAVTASNALADMRINSEKGFLEAQQHAAPDAANFTPNVLKGFDDEAKDSLKTIKDPMARQMLMEHAPEIRANLAERSMQYEAATRTQFRSESIVNATAKSASAVELNPDSWQAAGAEQIKALNALDLPPEQRDKLTQHVDQEISQAAARGYAKNDPGGTLKRLADSTDPLMSGLTTEQRTGVETYARQQFVEQKAQSLQNIYQAQGTTAGVKALSAIDHDQSIPADLRDPIRDQLMRQINVYRDQQREKFAPQLAQLESNIVNETAGPTDKANAWSLFQKGAYNTTQLTGALAQIDRSMKESAKKGLTLEQARAAYTAGTPLDPEENKKGVGLLFQDLTKNTQPGTPEFTNRALDITAKVGIAPDPAISWARSSLNGGNPQQAAQAADLIAKLDDTNPRAMAYAMDPKTRAISGMINEAVKSGADPEGAVKVARHNVSLAPDDVKTLDQRWTLAVGQGQAGQQKQSHALTNLLSQDATFKPHFWNSVPAVPLQMQSEFDALTKDYYRYTGGDVNQARGLAARDLKHVWGVSEVNGSKELMPYAPEAMFPGLTKDVVREDIASSVKGLNIDGSKVKLIPDPVRTARTQGSTWNLAAPDEHGLLDIVKGKNGNPLLYRLPVMHSDVEAVKAKQNEAAMTAAREEQARKLAYGKAAFAVETAHVSPF